MAGISDIDPRDPNGDGCFADIGEAIDTLKSEHNSRFNERVKNGSFQCTVFTHVKVTITRLTPTFVLIFLYQVTSQIL